MENILLKSTPMKIVQVICLFVFSWNQIFVYIFISAVCLLFSAVSGTSSILNGKVASYELDTKSETVTGILVRTFENNLNVMALAEDEKPGKSTDPKIK